MVRPLRNLTFAAGLSLIATAAAAQSLSTQGLSTQGLSTSANSPTPVAETGLVTGNFAPGVEEATHYLSVDLKPGDLTTQISFSGRRHAPKMLELALLDSKGRAGANSSHYVMSELDAAAEKTRAFPIDSAGRYTLRVSMSGTEGTRFKVDLGGSAYQPAE